MTGQQIIITLFSALISGIVTSLLLFVIQSSHSRRQTRKKLIGELLANQSQYLDLNRSASVQSSPEFDKVISQIQIVFDDDWKVQKALDRFLEKRGFEKEMGRTQKEQEFIILVKQLCRSARIDCRYWNDNRFIRKV